MPTLTATQKESLLTKYDRRRYQRVRVNLLGRFMLENRREYPCQTTDMSPGSCALITPIVGKLGERVVAYIDHIGRIDGQVGRVYDGGFAMSVNATLRKKDKLAAKLTWLANRYHLNLAEDRRHHRVTPESPVAKMTLADERSYQARIIDLSLSGAALAADVQPPIGAVVHLGALRANVVRHFEEGIAIEFAVLQTERSLRDSLGG